MLNRIIQLSIAAILTVPAFAGATTIDLPATNQTTCFNAGGGQIVCGALPAGQDGELKAGVAWPNPRFTDNTNGTVTDHLTGLIWSKHANAPNRALPADLPNSCVGAQADMTWQQALDFIACLNLANFAGFGDWRLPNLNELESMVNAEFPDSSLFLNASGFGFGAGLPATQVQNSEYWTSTTDVDVPSSAWAVSLTAGDFPGSTPKNNPNFTSAVWPVRGVSTAPAQLWRTGQTICSTETGTPRACAGTEEDGEKLAGAAWPVPRFQANAGATLAADKLTGLIWTTDAQTPGNVGACSNVAAVSWQGALDHVACLNTNAFLGRTDWRVPNRKELRSLIDYSRSGPALPAGHPFINIGIGGFFWTSTTDAFDSARAWTIQMLDGSINGLVKAVGDVSFVWPVSGPDAVPILTMNPVASPTGLASLPVSGTIESGTTPAVTVTVTAPATAAPVIINGTAWSSQISGLTEGAHSITVTAVDLAGNVATMTAAVTVNLPAGSFTPGAAVTIMDALKALRIAVGLLPAPLAGSAEMLHGDVAPLGAPDGRIDASDALLILKKAVGLVSF